MARFKPVGKKNKKRIKTLGDSVAKSSIEAIGSIGKPKKPSVESKTITANRKIFGPILLVLSVLIGFFLAPNLWPINKFLPESSHNGGTYVEGSVSSLGNLNPIFASENAEKTVAKLIFSSLFRYGDGGKLVGDLAKTWEANKDNTVFTVKLKSNLQWTDGEAINADDVVKTYALIQHPDAESPLRNSWRGVKVSKLDDLTVTFSLASAYSPFYKSLTNPIIPEHVFSNIPASEARLSDFSQQPIINSGPFSFKRLESDSNQAELQVNNKYHGSLPKVEEFIVKVFDSQQEMIRSYARNNISAMADVDLNEIQTNPELLAMYESDNSVSMPLNTSVFMFLKNDNELFNKPSLRRAISLAINTEQISSDNYGLILPLNRPLLSSQYKITTNTPDQKYDQDKANKLLNDAGWKLNKTTGIREKGKEKFEFTINVQNSGIFPNVARIIAAQLFEVGVKANISEIRPTTLQQNHILPHKYEAIIFGFEGNDDPDSFAIWHSSQVGIGGFNLSEISNSVIDETLEAGRTRGEENLRNNNYEAFLIEWNKQVPAVPLYSPNYVYIAKNRIKGIDRLELNSPEDRLNAIEDWYID